MTDNDRNQFDQSLDVLARILGTSPLNSEVKFGYFKALKHHSITAFFEAMNKLAQTYKPHRKDDFPVPAVINEAIDETLTAKPKYETSRTPEEITESYRRRGILIGDEAKRRLEDEIIAKVEAETGERIEDREYFFNGKIGSRDPKAEREAREKVKTEIEP